MHVLKKTREKKTVLSFDFVVDLNLGGTGW